VVNTCNPSTPEAETGRLGIQGQPGLHNKTVSKEGGGKKRRR
jgi:hypothetical protein